MFDDDEDDFLAPAAPWAVTSKSTQQSEDSSKTDIFSHRNTFDAITRDKVEHEKRKAEKAKAKQEKLEQRRKEKAAGKEEKTCVKRESGGTENNSGFKKRRINAEDSKKLLELAGLSNTSAIDLGSSDEEPEAGSVRRSPRTNRAKNAVSPLKSKNGLSNSFDQDVVYNDQVEVNKLSIPQIRPQSPPEEEEDEDSDPEIAELKRKARENARRKYEQAKKASSPDGVNAEQLPTPPPDATIQLFITSPIPGTKELIIHRKLSQPLSAVRQAWCARQEYDEATTDRIFFTYRGRKLYDSTTVRRLGFTVDADGTLHREDDPDNEDDGRVHIEAITEEIYLERKAEKERQSKLAAGQYDESDDQPEQEEAQPESQPQLQKLIVRAKGKPDFKLKVSPTTHFHKIIKAAKKRFDFTEDHSVYITFDDERLSPDEQVGNTELSDMDVVDMFLSN